MIPVEVENRIAKYFFHNYVPEDVMALIEDALLMHCLEYEEEDLDFDELVLWAVTIIREEMYGKKFR